MTAPVRLLAIALGALGVSVASARVAVAQEARMKLPEGAASVQRSSAAHAASTRAPTFTTPERVLLVDEPPFRPAYAHLAPGAGVGRGPRRGRHGRPYHPAPRVVVDVEGAATDPTSAALQRTLRNLGYWPFRTCFEEGARRNPALAGSVSLDIRLGPSGSKAASAVDVADGPSPGGGPLGDPVVAACVARETSRLALPASDPASRARVDVTFGAGDDPVFAPPPVRHASELREALRTSQDAVRRCFRDGVERDPALGGRMELRFTVRPDGSVERVTENETHFPDPEVTRCVLDTYEGAQLPPVDLPARDPTFVYALHFELAPRS